MQGHLALPNELRLRKVALKLPGDVIPQMYSIFAKVEEGVGRQFLDDVMDELNRFFLSRSDDGMGWTAIGDIYQEMVPLWSNKVLASLSYKIGPTMEPLRGGERNKREIPETDVVSNTYEYYQFLVGNLYCIVPTGFGGIRKAATCHERPRHEAGTA